MQYEICFLDQGGRLSCLMTGQFTDHNHASRFARLAMDTAACRGKIHSAEIHSAEIKSDGKYVTVSPYAQLNVEARPPRPVRASSAHDVAVPSARSRWFQAPACAQNTSGSAIPAPRPSQ